MYFEQPPHSNYSPNLSAYPREQELPGLNEGENITLPSFQFTFSQQDLGQTLPSIDSFPNEFSNYQEMPQYQPYSEYQNTYQHQMNDPIMPESNSFYSNQQQMVQESSRRHTLPALYDSNDPFLNQNDFNELMPLPETQYIYPSNDVMMPSMEPMPSRSVSAYPVLENYEHLNQKENQNQILNEVYTPRGALVAIPLQKKSKKIFKDNLNSTSRLVKEIDALNYTDVTVTQLKSLLRRCGAPAVGKKTELITRLQQERENLQLNGEAREKAKQGQKLKESNLLNVVDESSSNLPFLLSGSD